MSYKLLLSIIAVFFPIFAIAQIAEDIDFLVSWRAVAYVEPTYAGRIFPSFGTPVEVSFELLDGGKPVNLANRVVNWVLDERPLQSGRGLQTAQFLADPLRAGGAHRVRIVVTDYKGADRTFNLRVPVRRPELVIRAPFLNLMASAGSHTLRALLFYWNTNNPDELLYQWSLNGASAESAGRAIALTVPKEAVGLMRLTLRAQNRANDLESATAALSLILK